MATDSDGAARRRRLLEVAVRAVAADAGAAQANVTSRDGVAVAVADGAAWGIVDSEPHRSLAHIVLHAYRAHAAQLTMVVHGESALIHGAAAARRAQWIGMSTTVCQLVERAPQPIEPSAIVADHEPAAAHRSFVDQIRSAGAEVVIEHGVVCGEVSGLEVCRVVDGPEGAELSVGVGRHDRMAGEMLYGIDGAQNRLAEVVDEVRARRRDDAEPHPLQRLAPERLLRQRLVAEPSLVGADTLMPVPGLERKESVLSPSPAFAWDGSTGTMVTATTGLDLGAWPDAVDMADHLGAARIIIAMPARNRLRAHDDLCAAFTPDIVLHEVA